MITDYTSYASIRAVLGVSVKELADATLADDLYGFHLSAELRKFGGTFVADFAVAEASTEEASVNLVEAVWIFSAQAVAVKCLAAMPNIAPKSLTDGKAGFIRHTDKIYAAAVATMYSELSVARRAVAEAYATYGGTSAPVTSTSAMAVSSPTYDPVTGE